MLSDLGAKLLNLASDLAEAVKEKNWFKVNGVQNALIDMVEKEGGQEDVSNDQ
jgi:hypothetical protein